MTYKRHAMQPGAARTRGIVRTASRSGPKTGVSLSTRRRWYADEDEADAEDDDQPGADSDDADATDDETDDNADTSREVDNLPGWAQKLIRETRDEAAQYRAKMREIEKAQEKAEQERKAKQGEYKELWEGAQDKLARLEELEAADQKRRNALKEKNDARLNELPKAQKETLQRTLERLGADDPYAVSEALDDLIPALNTTKEAPGTDANSRGDRGGSSSGKIKLNRVSH